MNDHDHVGHKWADDKNVAPFHATMYHENSVRTITAINVEIQSRDRAGEIIADLFVDASVRVRRRAPQRDVPTGRERIFNSAVKYSRRYVLMHFLIVDNGVARLSIDY